VKFIYELNKLPSNNLSKKTLSKNSIALLILVSAVAVVLSLISFQYSSYTSAEILRVAAQNVQSNAKIQVHDIERILVNRIDAIATNLHIITNIIPSVRNGEFERGRQAFNAAQDSTSELTDFFMWLDRDGRMVWLSNINQTAYKTFRGTDLSYRDYFTETKNRLKTYYSSAIDSNDNVVRIYMAQPIINEQGAFEDAAVAAIRIDTLGTFLENELSPNTQRSVGILDRNGMILYAEDLRGFLSRAPGGLAGLEARRYG
jgi:hypothetical protein